jgi:hypothetical protein
MGHVLNMDTSNFAGQFPEIEDRMSDPATWTMGEPVAPAQLFEWMISLASDSLTEIFGPDLQPHAGRTFVIPEQRGWRSLGCFWAERPRIDVDPNSKKIHFVCRYQPFPLCLPITDIGLYGADHVTVDESAVANANAILRTCPRVLISVGVSRPYRKANDQPALHWLQVNNIHAALTARFAS